jgi:hypothetical protein
VAEASASITTFGSPSRDDRDIGCRQITCDCVLRHDARQPDGGGHAARPRLLLELRSQIAIARNHHDRSRIARRERPGGVDQMLEPFLAHQPSDREHERRPFVDPEVAADAGPNRRIGCDS